MTRLSPPPADQEPSHGEPDHQHEEHEQQEGSKVHLRAERNHDDGMQRCASSGVRIARPVVPSIGPTSKPGEARRVCYARGARRPICVVQTWQHRRISGRDLRAQILKSNLVVSLQLLDRAGKAHLPLLQNVGALAECARESRVLSHSKMVMPSTLSRRICAASSRMIKGARPSEGSSRRRRTGLHIGSGRSSTFAAPAAQAATFTVVERAQDREEL